MNVFRPLVVLTNKEMEEYYGNMASEGWILYQSTTTTDFFKKCVKQEKKFLVIPEKAEMIHEREGESRCLGRHKWYQVYEKQNEEKLEYKVSEDAVRNLKMNSIVGLAALLWIFCVIFVTCELQLKIRGNVWGILYCLSASIELFAWCWGSVRRINEVRRYKNENIQICTKYYFVMIEIQKLVTLNHFILICSLVFLWQ